MILFLNIYYMHIAPLTQAFSHFSWRKALHLYDYKDFTQTAEHPAPAEVAVRSEYGCALLKWESR